MTWSLSAVPTSSDDCPHERGASLKWHESVVLLTHDAESGLTVYARIGAWPNLESTQEWLYVETADGRRFRSLRPDLPMRASDRTNNAFGAGGLTWTVHSDSIHVTAAYADVTADLVYHDFYPSQECRTIGDMTGHNSARGGHLESSGTVSGVVVIDGQRFDLSSCLAHRDHSWGPRDGRWRVARWCVGTTGPGFSHSFMSTIDKDGGQFSAGMVVRDGSVNYVKDLDIVVFANMDGLTARGARTVAVLDTDEVVEVDMTIVSSMITGNRASHGGPDSYICSEGVFTSTVNGVPGIGCMTIANSVAGVGEEAKVVDPRFSTIVSGLSTRPQHEVLLPAASLLPRR